MSTSYYLRRRKQVTVYEQVKVLQSSGGKAIVWPFDGDAALVAADGEYVTELYQGTIPRPRSIADLRDLLAGGRYELRDEYGEIVDLDEVLG